MKILFLGDASNFHITLAKALNEMGHTAIVASDGSKWMNTDRHINISRGNGKLGAIKYFLNLIKILPQLKGYDVVQIKNPIFLNLRPEKTRYIFDYLKRYNGKIFLTALGTDSNYVKACLDDNTFKYSDYRIGNQPTLHAKTAQQEIDDWLSPAMIDHNDYITDNVDGIISCLYEYSMAYRNFDQSKIGYAGIPIDTNSITPHFIESEPEKVKFFIGIQKMRTVLKGTDKLMNALIKVNLEYPTLSEICIAENLPYAEYLEKLSQSHVILDQLYSYTPATNALIAMASGLIAVSGGEDDYYNFINEHHNRPIINVSPIDSDDILNKLKWIILNKSKLPELSRKSRDFVVKHNDSHVVAAKYIKFWQEH